MDPTTRRTPSPRRLLASLALLGVLAGAAPAAAVQPPAGTQSVQAAQVVGGEEANAHGREIIRTGHVDVGARFVDGSWTLQARDDRAVPPVWREPAETVFQVVDQSILQAPDSPDFAFLAVPPGTPLYVIPQVQNQDVVWLGWNTQDPEVTQRIDRGATLRLDGVQGPGRVLVFLQEGVTGPPNLLWDSGAATPQDLWMEVNTHVHANWVFTEPGSYVLDVTMLADLVDGTQVQDQGVLLFAVGSSTDPESVFAAAAGPDSGRPDGDRLASEPGSRQPNGPPSGEEQRSPRASTAVAVGAAGVVVVLAAWVGVAVARGRRARAAAERQFDGDRS